MLIGCVVTSGELIVEVVGIGLLVVLVHALARLFSWPCEWRGYQACSDGSSRLLCRRWLDS